MNLKNILLGTILTLILVNPISGFAQESQEETCNATPEQSAYYINLNLKYKHYIQYSELKRPTDLLGADQYANPWEDASNEQRNQYCKTIDYLREYITAVQKGQIATCTDFAKSAKDLDSKEFEKIQDSRCTELKSPIANEYYNTSAEARIDQQGNGDGKINGNLESCLQKKTAKVTECQTCRQAINNFLQNPNNEKDKTKANSTECEKYKNTGNCNTGITCSDASPEPQIATNRTPFGTEFFNVSDPQKGLNTTGSNFSPNVQGGPLIGTINTVANFLARMISVLSLLVFIAGAFILITANGEENQINRGKDAIKLSLVGIVIVMLSYTIVVLVQSIFF